MTRGQQAQSSSPASKRPSSLSTQAFRETTWSVIVAAGGKFTLTTNAPQALTSTFAIIRRSFWQILKWTRSPGLKLEPSTQTGDAYTTVALGKAELTTICAFGPTGPWGPAGPEGPSGAARH